MRVQLFILWSNVQLINTKLCSTTEQFCAYIFVKHIFEYSMDLKFLKHIFEFRTKLFKNKFYATGTKTILFKFTDCERNNVVFSSLLIVRPIVGNYVE